MLTELKEKLKTYNGKELQHLIHQLGYFESVGLDIPTARKAAQEVFNELVASMKPKNRKALENRTPKCKLCGGYCMVYPVNDSPGTMVGGDYKSVTQCISCMDQVLSIKPIDEY